MKIEIIGGDSATQKAVQDRLAGRGFTADSAAVGHTPLPWIIDPTDAEGRTVSTPESNAIAECGLDYSTLDPNPGRANARRIVTCVNACEGLERPNTQIPALRRKCAALRSEKRELLAVLDAIRAALAKAENAI